MFDDIPPPFGEVTRRWTHLTDDQRAEQASRLLGAACVGSNLGHVDRPARDAGRCYARLIVAGKAGDPVAFGWLASSHQPILIVRGQALYDHDPTEWGAVALEALHITVGRVDPSIGVWLRRRVVQHSCRHVTRTTARHLARRRREIPTAPTILRRTWRASDEPWSDPHDDLSIALDRMLGGLDAPTREGFLALANHQPLELVAARHHLNHDALRGRMTRARKRLQPRLAAYVRAVDR